MPCDFVLEIEVDNSEPLSNGFNLGFYLAFHGQNDMSARLKLATVYSQYCPALLTGQFLRQDSIIVQSQSRDQGAVAVHDKGPANHNREPRSTLIPKPYPEPLSRTLALALTLTLIPSLIPSPNPNPYP